MKRAIIMFSAAALLAGCASKGYDEAERRAREVWLAIPSGDVSTLKRYTTPGFYSSRFEGDDARTRDNLLSVPEADRQELIDHIKHKTISQVLPSSGEGSAVVQFTDTATHRTMTIYLLDADGRGDWRVYDYQQ